jgi:hypothetical protein
MAREYNMVHMYVSLPHPKSFEGMSEIDKARQLGEISSAADTFISSVPALVASTGKTVGEVVSHSLAIYGQTAILSFLIRS